MIVLGDVVRMLQNNVCVVEFGKLNSQGLRRMTCTLRRDVAPPVKRAISPVTPGLIPVWCLDNASWKSLYIDTVRNVRVVEARNPLPPLR